MLPHEIFFWAAVFFMAGVLAASAGLSLVFILTAAGLAAVLFFGWGWLNNRTYYFWLAGLTVFLFLGMAYFRADDHQWRKNQNIIFGEDSAFSGKLASNPRTGNGRQSAHLELLPPLAGRILINLAPYPAVAYGDVLKLNGKIKPLPDDSYGRYLAKERLVGAADFPEWEIIGQGQGFWLKSRLFSWRNAAVEKFQEFLPGPQAAFLSGLTVGERGEFSPSFKESLNRSGTTHLVALSGYNITILAGIVMAALGSFRRRIAAIGTVLAIIAFVVMTGAEASVVRAGLMGGLVVLARETGRLRNFRNAVALAALAMVLINPKVLAFDIGFQLSFLALLGIVYLKPFLEGLAGTRPEESFLNWRENFWTTTAAQLAVLPILLLNFGYFSLTALAANILVLEIMPLAMTSGFLLAGGALISHYLGWLLAWPALLFLNIIIGIVDFFGRWAWLWQGSFDYHFLAGYYLIMGLAVYFWKINERRIGKK